MKNQVSPGDAQNVIAPAGGMVSGLVYFFGAMYGVSSNTNVAGDTGGVIYTKGVYSLPKLNAEAWTVGAPVYWDVANKWATIVVIAGFKIGVATDPAANPSLLGNVRLNSSF